MDEELLNSQPQQIQPPQVVKKRPRLKLIFFAVLVFLVILLGMLGTLLVMNMPLNGTASGNGDDNETKLPAGGENGGGEEESTSTQYINTNLEFEINWFEENSFEKVNVDDRLIQHIVTFLGRNQENKINKIDDIEDGYMVQINVHKNVQNQDIGAIALEKRNNYIVSCPETAVFSNITDTSIASNAAKRFEIENCNTRNFVQTFVVRGGNLFEFIQIYKGDVGIRQVYKTRADEIVDLFKFTNIITVVPVEQWATHTNTRHRISFRYPSELDTTCCTINSPISENIEKIGIFVDPRSIVSTQRRIFNGFGVFVDINRSEKTFDEYVREQRELLEENYRIVIGRPATSMTSENLTVAGQPAIKLVNYAWWGDIIFIKMPFEPKILAISITQTSAGALDEIITEVLNSLNFEQ